MATEAAEKGKGKAKGKGKGIEGTRSSSSGDPMPATPVRMLD